MTITKMSNKLKLRKMLVGMSNNDSGLNTAFKSVEKEMARVSANIREEVELKTLKLAKKKIRELQEQIQIILDSFTNLKEELSKKDKDLLTSIDEKLATLKTTLVQKDNSLSVDIESLEVDIEEVSKRKIKIPDFHSQIVESETQLKSSIATLEEKGDKAIKESSVLSHMITGIEENIKKFRKDTLASLSRGGTAPSQINVNSSVMSTRYADINFQQAGNIGLSATNDDDNKRVNITASILVGGAGGSGRTSKDVTPTGTVNGSNKVFTLPDTPSANSLSLFLNGIYQTAGGVDYTLATATITYETAPPTGSTHQARYEV